MQPSQDLARRPRKQHSCTECQRRKQKCVFRRLNVACVNCSKRFPPVDCVRTPEPLAQGSGGPSYQEHEKTFDLRSWQEVTSNHSASLQWPALRPEVMPRGTHEVLRQEDYLSVAGSHRNEKGGLQKSDNGEKEARTKHLIKSRSNLILGHREESMVSTPLGGILTEVTTLNGFHLEYSARDTELLHFYVRFVAPNLASIDGEGQPAVFLAEVLPWQLQSPLMPNIGILMASATQALDKGVEMAENPESLLVKARVLSYINRFLNMADSERFHLIAIEALKCVINLVVMEWFWGSEESMRAHSRGIREMIRLQGGFKGINDPVLEAIIILTDYEIACCFEIGLQWQEDDDAKINHIPIPTSWPENLDCPLVGENALFDHDKLQISNTAAGILDDVRFLTISITSPSTKSNQKSKVQATAIWLHDRLKAMPSLEGRLERNPSEVELVEETIRLAALVYSWSVKALSPISRYPDASIPTTLYATMMTVSLTRWKKMLGVFLWIMLVLCPSSRNDRRGKFTRRKMAVAGLSIGFENFPLGISYLRAFWMVQQWVVHNAEVV